MIAFRIVTAALIATSLSACDKPAPKASEPRPVRAVTVEHPAVGETVSLTGQVRAKDQVNLAFRLDGRLIERLVNVGDGVRKGQIIARLDPHDEQNALRTAQANVASADAVLSNARITFWRQKELLKSGAASRSAFDQAQQELSTAEAQVASARAQARLAEDQLSYTVLSADAAGAVTAVGAEPGEVVHAGQMVVQVAHDGGRDAVFDVPEKLILNGPRDPVVKLALTSDPNVNALGRVREVAPQADPTTRTFQVKVGIIDPPPGFALGSTVTGSIKLSAPPGVEIPSSALTESNGRPAVWVVDRRSHAVAIRNVDVSHYDPNDVVVSQGLDTGDVVVTAGVQVLRPGQQVRLLGAAQ
jgi:membrane fusion protein, multidrug efflux system